MDRRVSRYGQRRRPLADESGRGSSRLDCACVRDSCSFHECLCSCLLDRDRISDKYIFLIPYRDYPMLNPTLNSAVWYFFFISRYHLKTTATVFKWHTFQPKSLLNFFWNFFFEKITFRGLEPFLSTNFNTTSSTIFRVMNRLTRFIAIHSTTYAPPRLKKNLINLQCKLWNSVLRLYRFCLPEGGVDCT